MLFHIACGVAVRPTSRKFSLLACFDLDLPQYLFTRVCEISFCYLEFIFRAQLCSVIFSSRRAFIPPHPQKKTTVCNFVLLVTYIYVLYPENSSFKIRFPQQLCLCLCKSMLRIGVDCMCCVMQILVLLMVSG